MRRAARIDKNQPEVVRRLRRCGVKVIITSMLSGEYTFDFLAVYRGKVYVVELKNPDDLPKYFFNLNRDEQREHLIEKELTEKETKTLEILRAGGSDLIVTYSADHCLREMGGLMRPFVNIS